MNKKKLANLAVNALKSEYPDAICSLVYDNPLELLIATRLAAQCTDARVNIVTKDLFKRFTGLDDFADADVLEVETYIRSCGFFKTKARDIVAMCRMLREDFNSTIPDSVEELIKLPGVGRKTANLIVGDVFKKPAVVVDTHCIRITSRLGFHKIKDPKKIEMILREVLPEDESNNFCHRLVLHGRAVCTARAPKCKKCVMNSFCAEYKNLFEKE